MAHIRERIRMTPAEVRHFLSEERLLNIATIGPTGWPHLVAMWFVTEGDDLAFWTFSSSQKVANLRRDNRITCLVEAGETYEELRGVEIRGRARLVEDPERVVELGRRLADRYHDQGLTDRELVMAQAPKRIGIVVEPDATVSWDHRKLAVGRADRAARATTGSPKSTAPDTDVI